MRQLEKGSTVESRGELVGRVIRFLLRRESMKPLFTVPILYQHFDFALGIFQDFEAAFRESNALFEDLQRFVQRQITLFQFSDDRLQPRHRLFKFDPAHDGTSPFMACEISLYRARFRFTSTDRAARA